MERRTFLAASIGAMSGLAAGAGAQDTGTKKVRLAVVAAGNRSRNRHVPVIRKHFPQVEIVAMADVTPEVLKQGLQAAGSSTIGYDDYRKMLAEQRGNIDAVLVVTPNFLHAPVTVDALEAGKHVLVEKPMATHLADADRMIAAARKNRRVLMLGQQSRYSTTYHRMAQLLREKAIGDVEFVIGSNMRSDWSPQTWRYTDPKTGKRARWRDLTYCTGSSLMEDGIHQLDVIHWLVGAAPKRIQATGGNNVFKDRETIDHAGLLIEFANGAKCTFVLTLFAPGLPNSRMMRFLGSEAEMDTESEPGGGQNIVIRRYRGKTEKIPVQAATADEQQRMNLDATAMRGDMATIRLHDAFLQAVASGEEPFASGKVGRDAIHISLAAERSLRTGRVIDWQQEEGL